MDTKIVVQIAVTRTTADETHASIATVTAEREARGLNPAWLADKLGTEALLRLDKRYDSVSKVMQDLHASRPENPPR